MIVRLLRHAEAIERSAEIEEEHRFLTLRGRRRFRKVCGRIRKLGIAPDLIVSSPLVRAVQTADILAEALGYDGELVLDARLSPGFEPGALAPLCAAYPQAQELVIVGHEPDFGRLAGALLALEAPAALKKGGMVSFRLDPEKKGHPQFLELVTGSGRVVTSRKEAIERLQKG